MAKITYSARTLQAAQALAESLMVSFDKDVVVNYITPDPAKGQKFNPFYSISVVVEKKEETETEIPVV